MTQLNHCYTVIQVSDNWAQRLLVMSDSGERVQSLAGDLVPQQIKAGIMHPDGLCTLLRIFVENDGSAVCFAIESWFPDGKVMGHRWANELESSLPYGMNLREWTNFAVTVAARQTATGLMIWEFPERPTSPEEWSSPAGEWWSEFERAEARQKTKRRMATTPHRLREVARLYREADLAGDSTHQAIAKALQVSKSQAAKLIASARERGFLGAATPRRRGEIQP